MSTEFVPNDSYIELLRYHSDISKISTNSPEYREVQEQLLKFEKQLSSTEIIKNTRIAFPDKTKK